MGINLFVFFPILLNGNTIIGQVVLVFINAKDADILKISIIKGRCKMEKEIPPWKRPAKKESKGKKFLVLWNEEVSFNCSVEIEAESEKDALTKWRNGQYENYERDESSNTYIEESEEAREIKE